MKSRHKYGARAVEVDGYTFASAAEAKRYGELKLLERAGEICRLRIQPEFPLWGRGGTQIAKYRADFAYIDKTKAPPLDIVEDVKGYRKGQAYQLFRLKAKLFQDNYGFAITEIGKNVSHDVAEAGA